MFFLLRKFVNLNQETKRKPKPNRIIKWGFFTLSFVVLTIITQIGGLVMLLAYLSYKFFFSTYKRWTFPLIFCVYYTIASIFIVPKLASAFGREQIKDNEAVQAHSFFYRIANRNYVNSDFHQTIQSIAKDFQKQYPGIKMVYTDANFPFIDGFPLLPHRYHLDGKKIDFDFVYQEGAQLSNLKPTFSGYGFFEAPLDGERNQINFCLETGYLQYEFTKHVTLGVVNPDLTFAQQANKYLIELMASNKAVETIFVEPHLQERLEIESDKIIYHGCGTVRHDDHIHLESL